MFIWLIPSMSLFEVYNGVIDGNTCTGTAPISTNMITLQAPTNATAGNIGIHQLAFQTAGDYYVYTGAYITMNGVSGTYNSKCCSCDAISQSINGGFSECGLTWCGQENQWQYVDFIGTSLATSGIPQNDTITIQFSDPIPIVTNINGYPIYSISYNILTPPSSSISPSSTRTESLTPSRTLSESITSSPTISNSVMPSVTQSPSATSSLTLSETLSATPSATLSETPSATLSATPSETSSETPSATLSATPSLTLSETPSITLSETLSTTLSETPSATLSATLSATPSETPSATLSATPSITLSITPSATLSETPSTTPSLTSSSTLSETPSETLSTSESPSVTQTNSLTSSITPSETLSTSETPSVTQTNSVTPSFTPTSSVTPSFTPTSSVTQSITPTTSITSSITSSVTNSRSVSKSETPEATISRSPSISPSGICYSVSTLYGMAISLSGGWIIVNTGINVTQAYGSGFISMGQFQSCQINALNKCVCSYTQGSTVAGCSGKRNSYITYSYGSTTDITYTNESPTCSYNFAGTIAVPSSTSVTPTLTRSITRTVSRSITSSVSFSPSMSQTRSETPFPTSTPLTRPVLIADSVADFPTIQGGNGWYYNYYDGTNVLHPMPYYGSSTAAAGGPFWQVQNSVCIISNAYAHTGHTSGCTTTVQGICKPTIFWNNTFMNNNTNYIVSYTAGHPSNPIGTDGVKMTLKQNGIILSNVFPTVNIAQTNYSIYNLSSVELIIDPLTQCNSDASTYNLKIYQYQVYPSVSSSITSTLSPSVTSSSSQTPSVSRTMLDSVSQSVSASPSFSSSVSKTNSNTASITVSITSSESSTISVSETITPTLSKSETLTPSLSASITPSKSITSSESISIKPSQSISTSLSISISSTGSQSVTSSSSLSESASTSGSVTVTKTESLTPSLSSTSSKTISSSKSISNSIQPTQSNTVSVTASITQSESLTSTVSATAIVSSNVTTTPLVYCIPYPSSSPTSDATSTSTPQFLITPWPTNGSASASTSPLFMMIPYPSSSNLPINITVYEEPFDSTGAIVGGTAIGALTVSSLFFLYNYLKPKQIQTSNEEKIEIIERVDEVENRVENEGRIDNVEMVKDRLDIIENIDMVKNVGKIVSESIQSTAVKIQSNKDLSYICVSTSDLEEIKQILIINGKRFRIMEF